MTLSSLFLTAKFEFVIISRHLVVKRGSQKSSVPKEFILAEITNSYCVSIKVNLTETYYKTALETQFLHKTPLLKYFQIYLSHQSDIFSDSFSHHGSMAMGH